MSASQSEACCSVPPVQAKDYQPKGKYVDVDGMKCYTVGPSDATSAIFIIYDIFGYSPQALQGADILANGDGSDAAHKYQVFMPDFFRGKPLDPSVYPPKTDEHKKILGDFFAGPAAPPQTVTTIQSSLMPALKKAHPEIKKYGSLGMCWGGKIVSLTAQKDTPFAVAAEVHPAMVDPKDAEGIQIPVCMLASKDEDQEAVKAFEKALKVQSHVETFGDQVHGWMAARGDLENERARGEYERGYKTLLEWYHKFL